VGWVTPSFSKDASLTNSNDQNCIKQFVQILNQWLRVNQNICSFLVSKAAQPAYAFTKFVPFPVTCVSSKAAASMLPAQGHLECLLQPCGSRCPDCSVAMTTVMTLATPLRGSMIVSERWINGKERAHLKLKSPALRWEVQAGKAHSEAFCTLRHRLSTN
jgi:hypothetical protein